MVFLLVDNGSPIAGSPIAGSHDTQKTIARDLGRELGIAEGKRQFRGRQFSLSPVAARPALREPLP